MRPVAKYVDLASHYFIYLLCLELGRLATWLIYYFALLRARPPSRHDRRGGCVNLILFFRPPTVDSSVETLSTTAQSYKNPHE